MNKFRELVLKERENEDRTLFEKVKDNPNQVAIFQDHRPAFSTKTIKPANRASLKNI